MSRITGIIQQTKNRFLNLFELETVNRVGTPGKYFVASRAEKTEDLMKNKDELKKLFDEASAPEQLKSIIQDDELLREAIRILSTEGKLPSG